VTPVHVSGKSFVAAADIIDDLGVLLTGLLTKRKLPRDTAQEIAANCAEQIRAAWGGQAIYFPRRSQAGIARRNRAIVERSSAGGDPVALCREFGISRTHLRRILAKQRKEATR
jgi:Mor family transcriptional regulator